MGCMQCSSRRNRAFTLVIASGFLAQPVHAQNQPQRAGLLEEIIVTATRVETNLQETPMSVQAFSGEDLDLRGIDTGRELGIMVPNVVINPGVLGELATSTLIRGLPGVTTYLDGVGIDNVGFLQRSFVEIERVEVLRGPQGTLFGRNSNGGAILIVTRPPADEFGARLDLEVGEFNGRTLTLAVDVPIAERFWTKWTASRDENDGFLESQTAPFSEGHYENSLLRADMQWEPTDKFSLRFNVNEENRHGSPARILRISNPQNPAYIAYNVLAGNPDYLGQARAIDPAFPSPPLVLAGDRFTPETHEQGYPGGSLGRWQTMSDTLGPTIVDQQYAMLTLDWRITERLSLKSLTAYLQSDGTQIAPTDASEFTVQTNMDRDDTQITSQELHLIGDHFNGRLQSLLGLYYRDSDLWRRSSSWWFWEFAIPNTGPNLGIPGPPGVGGRPQWNQAAVNYVRSWGATVGNGAVAGFFPQTALTTDYLFQDRLTERAFFGQLTIGLLDRLDLTLGFRVSENDGGSGFYFPADALRRLEPGTMPVGDPHAVASVIGSMELPDFGSVSTPRVAIAYRPTDEIFLYASYAEGFTQGAVVNNPLVPAPIILDPEVVTTRELGLRSDLLDNRLRFNATYFDSRWDGLRVPKRVDDPNNPGQPLPFPFPTSDGLASAEGLELELFYLPGERWELDVALGLLDTEYLDIGDPPANGTGLQPGIPFQYAPETSYSVTARYRLPLASGGELLFVGNYGWMDDYQRVSPREFQTKNPDGTSKPEPAYGVLNARVMYQPDDRWQLSVFGTNLTNEWYVNGGADNGLFRGYDFGTIGRPREVGVGLRFIFD
jgi:iron complex outermembrane receptor protein